MIDKILVSDNNTKSIITSFYNDLKTKIKNKDISLPYATQLSKSSYLKIDGLGNMFLNNNGQYIDLGNIDKDKLNIDKIYEIFNIVNQKEQRDTTPYTNMPTDGSKVFHNNGKYTSITPSYNVMTDDDISIYLAGLLD